MSIKRFDDDYYTPVCDACGKRLHGEFYLDDAIDAMKNEGWETDYFKMEHICPDCQEENS